LWSPAGAAGPAHSRRPLVLLAHGGGPHKEGPNVLGPPPRFAPTCGFAAAAIDAPGSGDRPRTEEDERFVAEIRGRMAAGEPVGPQVARYNAAQAEQAVPEWRATLDALQAEPGLDGPG